MINSRLKVSFVFVVLTTSLYQCRSQSKVRPSLEDLLHSISKLMQFFINEHRRLTFGTLLGIRFAEGQLIRSLEKGDSGEYLIVKSDPNVRQLIEKSLVLSHRAAELLTPFIKNRQAKLYNASEIVVGKPWIEYELKPQRIWELDENLVPEPSTVEFGDDYSSSWGDECLMDSTNGKCKIEKCWKRMSKMKTRLYYTTHQVLWFEVGILSGCKVKLEKKARRKFGSLNNLLKILCSNVILQMELIASRNFPEDNHDVFLEQGSLCGGMGFLDAVKEDWLREVLAWQNTSSGCFNTADGTDKLVKIKSDIASKNTKKKNKNAVHCGPHISGVGVAFLSVYLRLFLDPIYIQNQLILSLDN